MEKIIRNVIMVYRMFLMYLLIWTGKQLFNYVDVFCPFGEDATVIGVTFTVSEKYIVAVNNIEINVENKYKQTNENSI